MRSRLACLATTDVRPALARITTPVLYLRASNDRVVSTRLGLEMTSLLPNVKVVEIDGPHLLLQARPRECAAEIMQFVAAR
jgi:pimeloyl-ACP methyl ester carboxylesterase